MNYMIKNYDINNILYWYCKHCNVPTYEGDEVIWELSVQGAKQYLFHLTWERKYWRQDKYRVNYTEGKEGNASMWKTKLKYLYTCR